MFLKYPRKVRRKVTENLYKDLMAVIKRDTENRKFFIVKSILEVEDIKANTEIYTKYGKCKILNMQGKWYIYIKPSNVKVKKFREMRYRDGHCELISEYECIKEDLLKLYLDRIENMRDDFMNYRVMRFNIIIGNYAEEANESLRMMMSCVKYDRECSEEKYSYISNENMIKLDKIVKVAEEIRKLSQNP